VWLFVTCVAGLASGCGGEESTAASAEAGQFDSAGAWRLIERQVDVGQRPAGSPQLRKLATALRPLLPNGRFEAIPGEPALRNIVGTLPGRKPAIVVGAHYDTLAKPPGFVGANNGAAGTAVVIEVGKALEKLDAGGAARQVDLVLFDGEEPPAGLPGRNFYSQELRGSRAYVASHSGETAAMILLDYVGGSGLRLPREANSNPALWGRVLRAASSVGAGRYFSTETTPGIVDDHIPFLRTGVPSVDLIDWNYPGHDLRDGLKRLSRQSLDGVGETIVQLVSELREE
jgi:glutaminyl-peptide cyclotransferase